LIILDYDKRAEVLYVRRSSINEKEGPFIHTYNECPNDNYVILAFDKEDNVIGLIIMDPMDLAFNWAKHEHEDWLLFPTDIIEALDYWFERELLSL